MRATNSAAAAFLAVALNACSPSETLVTMQLVDAHRAASAPDSTYLVEVRASALTLFDRVLAGRRGGKPDTIPGIRVEILPAIVDDKVIVGLWTSETGGGPAGTFTYDLTSRQLSRGPLPVWMQTLAPFSEPAFSRDGRYLAYVAATADGFHYAVVRDWPKGNIVVRGPSGRRWGYSQHRRAAWVGDEVMITYDASIGAEQTDPVVLIFRGKPRDRMTRVDTYPYHPSMGEVAYPFDSVRARKILLGDTVADSVNEAGSPRD